MVLQATVDVVFLAFRHALHPHLEAWVRDREYLLMHVGLLRDAVWQVRKIKPGAVIVHVSSLDACALIERLRDVRPRLRVIAVPVEHSVAIEMQVLQAGPTYYHPDQADIAGLAWLLDH